MTVPIRRRLFIALFVGAPLLLALLAVGLFLLARQGGLTPFRTPTSGTAVVATPALIARGQYLARIGNCIGCHTAQGGPMLAGGRAFRTDYGTVYSTNLTQDPAHGIGDWSKEEFRHAMRHGVSRNGVLSPVFPFASFRRLSDDDLDALMAFLLAAPASARERTANAFDFPANLPGAMTVWRLVFLQPSSPIRFNDQTLERGAYLVNGVGHCATCHASRGVFASHNSEFQLWGERSGGWFASALHGQSLDRFAAGDVADYLQGGAPDAVGAYGLMADVVARNLQYLSDDDALAIEAYLRSLPPPAPQPSHPAQLRVSQRSLRDGRRVFEQHCADCHGAQGEGEAGKFPSLRGSPAISQRDPINLIKLVLFGAVAPTTAAHPAPYTMPPFAQLLSDDEVADVVNLLRTQANPDALPIDGSAVRSMAGLATP